MAAEVTGIIKTILNVSTICSKFDWEIDKFSTRILKVGEYLESPKFIGVKNDAIDMEWCLRLFPNGQRESVKEYLSIFVAFLTYARIEAVVTITFFDKEGKAMVTKTADPHVFFKDETWGYSNFTPRKFVTSSVNGMLKNDKLRIGCEVTYKITNQEVKDSVLIQLLDEYEDLFTTSHLSDVTLVSEGKELKAHKCILAKSSSVFAAMFNTDMTEKQTNVVQITDIKYDVLMEMIRFIYAGKINNIEAIAGDLAIAADKYALDGLKNICEDKMFQILNINNVINYVQLANTLRMVKLKAKAIQFIVRNARYVGNRPEFRSLPHDIVFEVFQCMANKLT